MAEFKKISETLELAKKEEGALGKASKLISAPQRYTMKKLAEVLGQKGDAANSEESARQIVSHIANKIGVPEDSNIGNAAKALGVAGLEVFGDPTNLIPVGEAFKFGAKGVEAASKYIKPASLESLSKLKALVTQGKINLSPEVLEKLGTSIAERTPKNIAQALPEKYEKVGKMIQKIEPEANYGKVTVKAPEEVAGTVKNIAPIAPEQNTVLIKPGQGIERLEGTTSLPATDPNSYLDYKFMDALKKRGQ